MKRCVLMVGNGFSISLLKETNLWVKIPIGSLLPPDESVQYLPFLDDRFAERPLWDEIIWPRLWSEYHLWKASGRGSNKPYDFFAHLARTHTKVFTHPTSKSIQILDFADITYELRYYLWQMFRYFDKVWCEEAGWRKVNHWSWYNPLKRLAVESNLTIISFNYDCFLDSTFYFQSEFRIIDAPGRLLYHPKRCCELLGIRQPRDVVLLKPHGSMMRVPYAGISFGQNPWLWHMSKFHIKSIAQGRTEYPVRNRCGLPPGLVPPGHNEKHLIDMDTDVVPAIGQTIRECDAFILCGLSAGEPDTAEVEKYLSNLRSGTPTIHVDLCHDTPAADLLKRYSPSGYQTLDISRVKTLPDVLM